MRKSVEKIAARYNKGMWWDVRSSARGEVLRREEAAGLNLSEAFFQRQELRDFPPLTRVAEIGQVEPIVAGVLGSGEP